MTSRPVLSTPTGRIAAAGLNIEGTVELAMWRTGVSKNARWHTGHCAKSRTTRPAVGVRVAPVLSEPHMCLTCLNAIGPVAEWVSAAQLLPDTYTAAGGRPRRAERELAIISSIRRSAGRLSPRVNAEMQRFADALQQTVDTYVHSRAFDEHMAQECAAAAATLDASSPATRVLDANGPRQPAVKSAAMPSAATTQDWAVVVMWAGIPSGILASDPINVLIRWAQFHTAGAVVGNDYAQVTAVPPAVAALARAVEGLDRDRAVCWVLGEGGTPEALRTAARLAQERLLAGGIRRMRPVRACVQSYVDACRAIDPSPATGASASPV